MAQLLRPFAAETAGKVAEHLISRFGSLSNAISAPEAALKEALKDHAGVADHLIGARQLMYFACVEKVQRSVVRPDDPALIQYIQMLFMGAKDERLHVIYMDAQARYLGDECLQRGSGKGFELRPRLLMERVFSIGAKLILLAHNHPSGSTQPSEEDIRANRQLAQIAAALDIELLDHLIVANGTVTSCRKGGWL